MKGKHWMATGTSGKRSELSGRFLFFAGGMGKMIVGYIGVTGGTRIRNLQGHNLTL